MMYQLPRMEVTVAAGPMLTHDGTLVQYDVQGNVRVGMTASRWDGEYVFLCMRPNLLAR